MTKALPCSVIIPAYNEEAVIARCLGRLLEDAPPDSVMEIIVSANGCRDRTVEIARTIAPDARIIDLAKGSKTAAINAANAIATHFPRIVLDADVECDYSTVMALVEALEESGGLVAAPAIRLNLDQADWFIRAYYRVWINQPYAKSGNGGAGCYAISQSAFEQFKSFPDIIGDDIWIHTRFAKDQKRYVTEDRDGEPVLTVVHPPRKCFEQIRVEARRQVGNAQVLQLHPSPHAIAPGGQGALWAALRNGSDPLDVLVHFGMKACARVLAKWIRRRGNKADWSRDLTTRQA